MKSSKVVLKKKGGEKMIAVFKTEEGVYVLEVPKYIDLTVLDEVEEFLDKLEEAEERMIDWGSVPHKTLDELKEFVNQLSVKDWVTLGEIFSFLDDFFVKKIAFYHRAPHKFEQIYLVEDVEYDWKTNKVKFEYGQKTYELSVLYIDFWLTRRD